VEEACTCCGPAPRLHLTFLPFARKTFILSSGFPCFICRTAQECRHFAVLWRPASCLGTEYGRTIRGSEVTQNGNRDPRLVANNCCRDSMSPYQLPRLGRAGENISPRVSDLPGMNVDLERWMDEGLVAVDVCSTFMSVAWDSGIEILTFSYDQIYSNLGGAMLYR
jgi:hypothetical protein